MKISGISLTAYVLFWAYREVVNFIYFAQEDGVLKEFVRWQQLERKIETRLEKMLMEKSNA